MRVSKNKMIANGARREGGFSLLEVLITVVVISIGLLGLAGLQFVGLRAANSAQDHTLANLLLQDIEERIRANPMGAANGDYNGVAIDVSSSGYGGSVDCYSASCTWRRIDDFDFNQWYRLIVPLPGELPLLPNASINITSADSANYQATIQWGDPSGRRTLTGSFSRL